MKSRRNAGLELAFLILFFVAYYAFQLPFNDLSNSSFRIYSLVMYVLPLFWIPMIVRLLKVMTSGEVLTLNGGTKLIERNGVQLAHFGDVERVQIRTIHDSEGSNQYRLSIVLKNDEKLQIDLSSDLQEITAVADDIADVLDVDVIRKDRSPIFSISIGDA